LPELDLRERGLRPPPGLGFWRRLWWWFDFIILVKLARLRFLAVLLAVGGTIAYWDTLRAHYERWTRPGAEQSAAASDSEFWCPMHPTIVRDKPDKCPICGMPLSRRKKGERGEEEPLPPGVVSRVQLTPYRVALAGIRTAEVEYHCLHRDISAAGFVEYDERKLARITARATGKSRIDKLHVNVTGQAVRKGDPLAQLYSPDLVVTVQNLLDARRAGNANLQRLARDRLRLWGIDDEQIRSILRSGKPITHLTIRSPISGYVIKKYQVEGEYVEEGTRLYDIADLSTVWVEAQVYEDELAFLRKGLAVKATPRAFPNRPFEGKLVFLNPSLDPATRTLKVRFDIANPRGDLRPGMYATVTLRAPAARLESFSAARTQTWRDQAAADLTIHALLAPAHPAAGAGLPSLLAVAVEESLARQDQVLAVPERAVIDTGSRKLVYREAEPDVYEGVEVELGPRGGDFYPVLRGLQPGDRVATSGSFLIDAETRLTAGAGSTYFGASSGPHAEHRSAAAGARPSITRDEESKAQGALARLNAEDRRLAQAQGYCVVLADNRLGSMGVPVKLLVEGQPVFVCCKGCVNKARTAGRKTLEKAAEQKARTKAGTPPPPSPTPPASTGGTGSGEAARIERALSRLSPEDRRLAEAQGYCPIDGGPLGHMGTPVKVLLEGQPVFVCCKGCVDEARENPAQTLAKVKELQARVKNASPGK
jgi:Cu(I)/Ag(I) efflux system membrane fusion protein